VNARDRVAALLRANLEEAARAARSLEVSLSRVAPLLPLTPNTLAKLDENRKETLDAFTLRFIKLQDALGARVFRSLLAYELEEPGSMLDTLNKMAKRGIAVDAERWTMLRQLRNSLTHDYPDEPERRAAGLSQAIEQAEYLLAVEKAARKYAAEKEGISLPG
jgi:hypothetical protein